MGVRIQELPETTGINKEDVLIVEDGQGTKKGTVQQLDETLGVSQLKEDLVELSDTVGVVLNKRNRITTTSMWVRVKAFENLKLEANKTYKFSIKYDLTDVAGHAEFFNSSGTSIAASESLRNKTEESVSYTPTQDIDGVYCTVAFADSNTHIVDCSFELVTQTDNISLLQEKTIIDFNSVKLQTNSGDLIKDIIFYSGKAIKSNVIGMNIFNYTDYMIESSYGGLVAKNIIRIRDENGCLIKDLYFMFPSEPKYDEVNVCYTFGKDGKYLRLLEAKDISNYNNDDVYYILLIGYSSSVSNLHVIYDDCNFEVGTTKEFTKFNDCLNAIKHIPYKKTISVYGGTYDIYNEYGGDAFAESIASDAKWRTVNVVVPDNTKIIGIGYVTLKMTPTNISSVAGGLLSPLNISGNVEVENIHIVASNCRYGIHIEGSALSQFDNAKHIFKNVSVVVEEATQGIMRNDVPCMGIGLNGGCYLELDNCKLTSDVNDRCIFLHDNTFSLDVSPNVVIKNSMFNTSNPTEGSLNLNMYNNENTVLDIDIHNSYVPSIKKWTSDSSANDIYNIKMLNCNDSTVVVDSKVSNVREVIKHNVI